MNANLKKIYWVCGTHWDREWHRPFEGFRCRLVDMVDRAIHCIENVPGYGWFFLDGQSIILTDYLQARPEMRARVERLLREDKLFAGPFYVLQDESIEDGELFVRNLQKGIALARAHGVTKFVGYSPDSFGHCAQLPQLLKLAGVDSMVFGRAFLGRQQDNLWIAPDGSEVRFCWLPFSNGPGVHQDLLEGARHIPEDREIARAQFERFIERLDPHIHHSSLIVMDAADHLSADPAALQVLSDFNEKHPAGPRAQMSSLPDAIKGLFMTGTPDRIHGEIRMTGPAGDNWLLPGTLTSRMPLKHALSDLTRRLLAIEKLQTMRAFSKTHFDAIERAWDHLLQNIPHDSICGCHSDEVYIDNLSRFVSARAICEYLSEKTLRSFAPRPVRTGSNATAVFFDSSPEQSCFKPFTLDCPYPIIADPQCVTIESNGVDFAIAAVEEYPTFAAHLKTYRITGFYRNHTKASVFSASVKTDRFRPVLVDAAPTELLQFLDSGDAGDTYNYSPPPQDRVIVGTGEALQVEARELAPGLTQTRVEVEFALPAALSDDRKSRSQATVPLRIRYSMTKDRNSGFTWISGVVQNSAKDHRLRLVVPVQREESHSFAGAPFHIERRPVKLEGDVASCRERPLTDYPFVDFIRYGGVSVYGEINTEYQVTPRGIEITLCRSVGWLGRPDLEYRKGQAGPRYQTPLAQLLDVEIPFAFVVSSSPENPSDDFARSRLLTPTLTQLLLAEGPIEVRESLPVKLDGAQLSSLRWINQEQIEIRLFNPRPESTKATIFPSRNAIDLQEVDLNHARLGDTPPRNQWNMRPFQLLTLLAHTPTKS